MSVSDAIDTRGRARQRARPRTRTRERPRLTSRRREAIADWLILVGGLLLLLSLFLPWSHQFGSELTRALAGSPLLSNVPADPTAWQVYSVADVLLAALAVALLALALMGRPRARAVGLLAAALGLAFVAHASGHPPTNAADVRAALPGVQGHVTGGAGETLAIAALCAAIAGLGLGFTVPE